MSSRGDNDHSHAAAAEPCAVRTGDAPAPNRRGTTKVFDPIPAPTCRGAETTADPHPRLWRHPGRATRCTTTAESARLPCLRSWWSWLLSTVMVARGGRTIRTAALETTAASVKFCPPTGVREK